MAKTKISEFSTTAGNNTDINSINIAEGCAPSGINDAIRELMRQLKEFQTGGAGDSVNSGGDFSVATNKFTVASASGNTAVAGTLAVTGVATLTAQPILSSLTASKAVFTDASKGLVSNDVTGTGNVVMSNSPTLVTPALGTPSSGVVTNLTGTASININGTVGATTPSTGAFTTLSSTGNTTLGDASGDTITVNGTTTFVNANPTLSAGTANGVLYLNGSKVATSGSALTFDGTTFKVAKAGGVFGPTNLVYVDVTSSYGGVTLNSASGQNCFFELYQGGTTKVGEFGIDAANSLVNIGGFGSYNTRFYASGSEQMRLTSTGLGIGTSSPTQKLDVNGNIRTTGEVALSGADFVYSWAGGTTGQRRSGLYLDGTNNVLRFYTNQAEVGRFDSSGNLGIGTSSPTEKLTANGGIVATAAANLSSGAGAYLYYTSGTTSAELTALNPGVAWLNQKYNALAHIWSNSGSEAMRLTSTGLGIGTSSPDAKLVIANPATGVPTLKLSGFADGTAGIPYAIINFYNEDGSQAGPNNAAAIKALNASSDGSGGQLAFYTALSTASEGSDAVERMRLDSSGNLGLGVTPSAWDSTYKAFQSTTSALASASGDVKLLQNAYYDGGWKYMATQAASMYSQASGAHNWRIAASGTAGNAITFTQAMTLDASGNLLVGKTAISYTTDGGEIRANGQINSSLAAGLDFWNSYSTSAGAYRFYVTNGGTIFATSTTISAISDQRLKENIRDLDVGINAVMALKPRLYDWKNGKGANIKNARGFIAQEFEQVFPDLIDEWKDPAPEGEEPYKSVRQDLIPVLVKAIQEQQAQIESLRKRLADAGIA